MYEGKAAIVYSVSPKKCKLRVDLGDGTILLTGSVFKDRLEHVAAAPESPPNSESDTDDEVEGGLTQRLDVLDLGADAQGGAGVETSVDQASATPLLQTPSSTPRANAPEGATPLSHKAYITPAKEAKNWQNDGHYSSAGARVENYPNHLVIGVKSKINKKERFFDEWLPGVYVSADPNNEVKLVRVESADGETQLPSADHAVYESFVRKEADGRVAGLESNPFPMCSVPSLYVQVDAHTKSLPSDRHPAMIGSHAKAEDMYHWYLEEGQIAAKSVEDSFLYQYRSNYSGARRVASTKSKKLLKNRNRRKELTNRVFVDLSGAKSITLDVADFELTAEETKPLRKQVTIPGASSPAAMHDAEPLFIGAMNNGGQVTRWYLDFKNSSLITRRFAWSNAEKQAKESDEAETKQLSNPELGDTLYIGFIREVNFDSPRSFMDYLLQNDGALVSAQQICADSDATEAVWNGVVTRFQVDRRDLTVVPASPSEPLPLDTAFELFHWIITVHCRYGTNCLNFFEERRHSFSEDQAGTRWALDDVHGEANTYTDTLWRVVPRVPVFGNAGKEKFWQNLRMRRYGITSSDTNPQSNSDVNTDYITFVFSTLKLALSVEASDPSRGHAYAVIDANGFMHEFTSEAAYQEGKRKAASGEVALDGTPLNLEAPTFPSGADGRCSLSFFDVPADFKESLESDQLSPDARCRPHLITRPVELGTHAGVAKEVQRARALARGAVLEIVELKQSLTTFSDAYNRAQSILFKSLAEHWGFFTGTDASDAGFVTVSVTTADAAYAHNALRCHRLVVFFTAVLGEVEASTMNGSSDDARNALFRGALLNATAAAKEVALMHPSANDLHRLGSTGNRNKSFAGDVRFDDYSTGSYWSFCDDDAFVHFLDNRGKLLDALSGGTPRDVIRESNGFDWCGRVFHQARNHLHYIMRRKYVQHPKLMLDDKVDCEFSIEEHVGALLTDPKTGCILSVDFDDDAADADAENFVYYFVSTEEIAAKQGGSTFPAGTPVFMCDSHEGVDHKLRRKFRIQDTDRQFPELGVKPGVDAEAGLDKVLWATGSKGDFTFTRGPCKAKMDEIINERKCDVNHQEAPFQWQGARVLDFAKNEVEGAAEWAGHCDIKAAMESFGITPLPVIDRVVIEFEDAKDLHAILTHFDKIEDIVVSGKKILLVIPESAELATELQLVKDRAKAVSQSAGGGAVDIKYGPTKSDTIEKHLKVNLQASDSGSHSIYCLNASHVSAKGGRKGVVDSLLSKWGRVVIRQPRFPPDHHSHASAVADAHWLQDHVDNPTNVSRGLVTVLNVEGTSEFLLDCVNRILHGMRPVTQYFVSAKTEVTFTSADVSEMFASMVDLGGEDTELDVANGKNGPPKFDVAYADAFSPGAIERAHAGQIKHAQSPPQLPDLSGGDEA